MTPRKPSPVPATAGLRRRLIGTVLPAAIGCAAGFWAGQRYGDADLLAEAPGMYATMGAVVGILAVRVGAMFWLIIREFTSRSD